MVTNYIRVAYAGHGKDGKPCMVELACFFFDASDPVQEEAAIRKARTERNMGPQGTRAASWFPVAALDIYHIGFSPIYVPKSEAA